uniref:ATP-dependent DNA helicase n=1 Tax=Nicotiana tabacum TaxID=4097 RepID=A0A1S4A4F4_TOBAC|nr:PREDICTED: ATP-dependent DNA helicase pfh1-like [Nicotiana tabacum]
MGGDINEYQLIPETIRPSVAAKEANEVRFERTFTVTNKDILLHKKLNKDQLRAYNIIIERLFSNKAGAFFIDGPGGTGKTFLYRALLATVRSKGYIALATATSGVAASILPGGRTAHSRFKIPINTDDNVTCNISKQSSPACLIQDTKLIIWDEVSMTKKRMIELLDLLLKDLMDSTILFGGKVIVFGGDFRQTLPVVRNGKKEDFINERNGEEKVNSTNKIQIPTSLIIPYTTEKESLDKLFAITYPDVHIFFSSSSCTSSRIILTTKNDFVEDINDMLVARFPEESKTFIGIDETIESHDQLQSEDLLHSLNSPGRFVFQLPAPVASEEIGESSNTKLENVELKKEIENEDNSQSNVEQFTPREERAEEGVNTEGGSSTKREQGDSPKKK